MYEKSIRKPRAARLAALWAALGPGVLAALADNDAGGIISYALTGAKFGAWIFVPLTLGLVLITYTVQEMAMRLGVVSGASYTELVRRHFGRGWMAVQVGALFIENLIVLLTEFIGMSAGLVLIGLPLWAAAVFSAALVLSLALFSGYRAKERIGIVIGLSNVVFLLVAFSAKPVLGVRECLSLAGGADFFWYAAALVGNAIAPWMIFYQTSAYVDKGVKARQLKTGRTDTRTGCICQVAVAAALIWIGASLFGVPGLEDAGPAQLVSALEAGMGRTAGILFALGLFDSGLLAAITVSLSSSWSVAAAFGWAKSLNDSVRDAPGFYAVYAGSVCAAAAFVLVPGLPLNWISVLAQVAGGILMTPILIFLTLLTSNKSVMGEYASTGWRKAAAWACTLILSCVSLLVIARLFPL